MFNSSFLHRSFLNLSVKITIIRPLLRSYHKYKSDLYFSDTRGNCAICVNSEAFVKQQLQLYLKLAIMSIMASLLNWLLPRDAMRKRGLCCRSVSVCHVGGLYPRGWRYRKTFSRSGSPTILVLTPSANTQFKWEPLHRGHKIHGGEEILRFSTEIVVYLGNGTR